MAKSCIFPPYSMLEIKTLRLQVEDVSIDDARARHVKKYTILC